MQINYDKKSDKFIVTSPLTQLDLCRGIPNRSWDKKRQLWVVANVERNKQYFKGLNPAIANFGVAAMEAMVTVQRDVLMPLPLNFKYKTIPFEHQNPALGLCIGQDGFGLFMDPGTGKSKILVDDATINMLNGLITACVIVCPNSIKSNWLDEFTLHCSVPFDICTHQQPANKIAQQFITKAPPPGGLKVLVMGIESMSQGGAISYLREFLLMNKCVLDVDESSRIKTHSATRTQRLVDVAPLAVRRRIASGTPSMKGQHELWSQFEFLDPNILFTGFYAFRNHYCVMGGYEGKKVVGDQNRDDLMELIGKYVFVAREAECQDLPPRQYQTRRVKPTMEQVRLYRGLLTEKSVDYDGGTLTYQYAITRDLRLQQICAGMVYVDKLPDLNAPNLLALLEKGKTEWIKGGNPVMDEIESIIDENEGKFIIWARFRMQVDYIAAALKEKFGAAAVVEFHGDVGEDARTAARRTFQSDPKVKYFVGQVSTGGIGITLTAAWHEIYASNSFSAEDRLQSEKRAHRAGQDHTVMIWDVVMDCGWVDSAVLDAVQNGIDYNDRILNNLKRGNNGPLAKT